MHPNSLRNVLGAALLVATMAAASACSAGPAPPPRDTRPALTDEKIRDTIVGARVDVVPEESGAAQPISWRFLRDEPTELTILERQVDGDRATVLVDVTTRSTPRSTSPKALSGRLRLHYGLETELFLRRWRVTGVENLSMTYRDLPKPDAEPGEGGGPPRPPEPPPAG